MAYTSTVIHLNGTQMWYVNGKLHRTDGPAVIYPDGAQAWWVNGSAHKENGPAIIYPDGSEYWCINGLYHRTDGPAIIDRSEDYQEWRVNHKRHRIDGPAIITRGTYRWWINHKNITQEVENWMEKQNITWPWDDEIQTQFILTFV